MGDQLTIHATAWPRNGRLGQWAVGLESSLDPRSRAQILAWRNGYGTAVAGRRGELTGWITGPRVYLQGRLACAGPPPGLLGPNGRAPRGRLQTSRLA